jgi:hypothetical protein
MIVNGRLSNFSAIAKVLSSRCIYFTRNKIQSKCCCLFFVTQFPTTLFSYCRILQIHHLPKGGGVIKSSNFGNKKKITYILTIHSLIDLYSEDIIHQERRKKTSIIYMSQEKFECSNFTTFLRS